MAMRLVRPDETMEAAHADFLREWEAAGEELTPYSAGLFGRTYAEWLAATYALETVESEGFVTADTYFYVDDGGRIVGAINLRHELNDYLLRYGGHIGYGVRPSERGKGYATAMLRAVLEKARERGLERVMVACYRKNAASAAVIRRCGGVLENEAVDEDGGVTQRYWIEV